MLYKTEEELLYKAKQAEGKTFGEIDKSGRIKNKKAKGQLGQIIEESFFNYQINSKSEADFANLEIELKVTPIKKNKNGTLSAKERLVLNIINYQKEVLTTFETSSFWKKNKKPLILFYEWIPKSHRADYKLIKAHLLQYPEEDLEIIKQDWEIIVGKIKEGRAHELSEADTNYLAACTKGANKNSLRSQPYSDIEAMQRAYSLKQSYMTALVRKEIKQEDLVRFAKPDELRKKSLFELLSERFNPYIGNTLEEIAKEKGLRINSKSKNFLQSFVSELLGIRGTKLNQIEEFAKANIEIKTIRLEPDGLPKEHMSFRNIDFYDWATQDWENSWLKNYFEETKFLFVVFHYKETKAENPTRQLYFNGITLWNMPFQDINESLQEFWKTVQDKIIKGIELNPVEQKNRRIVENNLPKPGHNGICHIRPKARDGKDKVPLPDGRYITKQAFWLDRAYIGDIIKRL
ncbi:restriction endonuclease [Sediminibacillus dalangtanensis]|uniref:Restriction endonuclease n=1 Tax=Sediminibacillus dalangtanensis TaxID=2729421 RepID=A0ABX7VPP4_9BACI|nr:Sau3AI family type II restriction endonuclease [Sediminibacillus dalangtanensis]QTM98453.1 restriction endonuclease [Sediminibacillus dalangtanensis]